MYKRNFCCNSYLAITQHRFCSGRLTITSMHAFFDYVVRCLDAGEHPVGIITCVKSFLTGRTLYVDLICVRNGQQRCVTSDLTNVSIVLPLGSVRGPVVSLFYVNDVNLSVARVFFQNTQMINLRS